VSSAGFLIGFVPVLLWLVAHAYLSLQQRIIAFATLRPLGKGVIGIGRPSGPKFCA